MTQTLNKREEPLNPGGGWASPAPFRTWSSCHRGRRGAPVYKRRQHHGPGAEYEPQRKQPKPPRYGPGPWFQPPRSPYWAMYSNWGCWGGPWCPPPMGYRKPPGPVQVTRMYGLHPVCLCCCFCWRGPCSPGWARPPGRKNMQAPRNTTQFIMNQIYEDMRQQEALERQRAPAGGEDDEDDAELPDALCGFGQNPCLAFSPAPGEENQRRASQLAGEEEEEKYDEDCDGKEDGESAESEEDAATPDDEEAEEAEDAEAEAEEAEDAEAEEADYAEGEQEEGLEEEERRAAANHLPLDMPLSFLAAEEERENFIDCAFLRPEQLIAKVPQEALLVLRDTDC
ncbi:PREDICTED: coiled-coil domain-containing glutamate-rich protein 1 [Miniopterus natalensis]|uniref:coiled-coil domain-containing glutamate-rich protein 1 n=1 Tax=Miniopterus natalensis TaxID=291302 RepID=UPI0007A6C149|nr:PREDICTED: coiled-coil domain-containing glutamate-rich protein 1 [Miniopterus natalensis]